MEMSLYRSKRDSGEVDACKLRGSSVREVVNHVGADSGEVDVCKLRGSSVRGVRSRVLQKSLHRVPNGVPHSVMLTKARFGKYVFGTGIPSFT